MLDFVLISTRNPKRDVLEVYPKFLIKKSNDLMVRGRDFYAVWDENAGLWSKEEDSVIRLIDMELRKVAEEKSKSYDGTVKVLYMIDADSGSMSRFHQYVQKHMRDNFEPLDEKIIFSDTETNKKDYASKRLPYSLSDEEPKAWNELVGTLYSPEEKDKLEWAIGSIVKGDSKWIQKFVVLYGEGGTGKSTVINIIQKLFEGYYSTFDAKALGSNNAPFALEPFSSNPLVAIQHDGDLSRIEDNTRLNSIVSHEMMSVNEKFKASYVAHFNAFLFMGTNRPVKITDAKSGIIRRLIDVSPTGKKVPRRKYNDLVNAINFELGSIAKFCLLSYEADPGRYDDYIPSNMLGYSNDFYNFVMDNLDKLDKEEGVTLNSAYALYSDYCEESKIQFPLNKRAFKSEMSNYFEKYAERVGFFGFIKDKFITKKKDEVGNIQWINLKEQESVFDRDFSLCKAQYASESGKPLVAWDDCTSKLNELDTSKVHYVMLPLHHIILDFDFKDENGEKSLEKNLKEACKWPKTYAEVSKSGGGLHLHYFYSGDPESLVRIIKPGLEIKVFTGKSSLRRKLSLCNDLPISTISSGLPIKEVRDRVINFDAVKDEMHLRNLINKALKKEVHPGTKPNIDFIYKCLEDAYRDGVAFDVTDLRPKILNFAMRSTNQSKYCVDLVSQMEFKSEDEIGEGSVGADGEKVFVFFDIEVFKNLLVICYKPAGGKCVRMINPKPYEIEPMLKMLLIGFNCRKYDNHILYAAWKGYSNLELYNLSQRIINGDSRNAFFGNAYNISYTDIYDFSSKKQSLKKWEIELGIHHQELGLKWDEEVPRDLWDKVAEYCENDVEATEAVFNHLQDDFRARLILAEIAGMSPNTTTNTLTGAIIFGKDKSPQREFNYRDLAKPVRWSQDIQRRFGEDYIFHIFDEHGDPTYQVYDPESDMEIPDGWSVLPFFPGYIYEKGVSTYLGVKVGEGGRVYAEPGFHGNVALSDVASMHPHSIISEALFGPYYTKRFADIVNGRIAVKHKDFKALEGLLDGAFMHHIDTGADPKALAYALKIAINSVYGLTSANFDNLFRDIRNKDNIVAKRGALFMTKLAQKVQDMGYTVASIRTDSIKIPDADKTILEFIEKFGLEYGYSFEHEATYEKMVLVNDAVYIAKLLDVDKCDRLYGYIPEDNAKKGGKWTATGTQFQVPYVFKTLFSHEGIEFKDLCITNTVKTALYLDMNEKMMSNFLEYHGIVLDGTEVLDENYAIGALKTEKIKKKDAEVLLADPVLHDYRFVGKVGSFVPIIPGAGGGLLLREKSEGGYGAVGGSKGYRWLEVEKCKLMGKTGDIDMNFYENMVLDAKKAIEEYCDFTWFSSDDPYISRENVPYVVK